MSYTPEDIEEAISRWGAVHLVLEEHDQELQVTVRTFQRGHPVLPASFGVLHQGTIYPFDADRVVSISPVDELWV